MVSKPAKLFISYAHEDELFKEKLSKHLSLLKRRNVVDAWSDRMITPGDEWKQEIDTELETADIVLLLVSSDFLASDYCYDVEMNRAMVRHGAGDVRVIPIIVRPVDWTTAPFAKLQALPRNAIPISQWPNEDAAFDDIAKGIRDVVEGRRV